MPPHIARLWPLPALLVWAAAWGLFALLIRLGLGTLAALLLASGLAVAGSVLASNWWRRLIIGLGFLLSLALSGAATLAAWHWLLPLGPAVAHLPVRPCLR